MVPVRTQITHYTQAASLAFSVDQTQCLYYSRDLYTYNVLE